MDDECPKGKIAVLDGDIWDLPEEGRTDGLISFIMFFSGTGSNQCSGSQGSGCRKKKYIQLKTGSAGSTEKQL